MPAIKCICGNKINYGEIPNPNELLTISDIEYDKFEGSIDAEVLYKEMKSILRCSHCNRLLYFENGFDHEPKVYKLEK